MRKIRQYALYLKPWSKLTKNLFLHTWRNLMQQYCICATMSRQNKNCMLLQQKLLVCRGPKRDPAKKQPIVQHNKTKDRYFWRNCITERRTYPQIHFLHVHLYNSYDQRTPHSNTWLQNNPYYHPIHLATILIVNSWFNWSLNTPLKWI
jgi:hypothetical protein